MRNLKKLMKNDIAAIMKSNKTFKDIYNVIFSHNDLIAYERLVDFDIEAVIYKTQDLEIRAFAAYIKHTYPDTIDEYVGIDLPNTPNFLTAFWGVLMSGNKPYLVNSFYPLDLKVSLLKTLNIKLVITDAAEYNLSYAGFAVVNIDAFNRQCPQITDGLWQNEFALSSALTGLEAKICVFDGEAVVNQILNTIDIIENNHWIINDYQNKIKVAMILPLFHIFGIMVSYFWFAFFGFTMVFFKNNSPDTIRGTINRHKVTHVFAPPILFHKLYRGIMKGISHESEKRKRKFQRGINLGFALQNIFPSLGVFISRILFKEVLSETFGKSPRFMISGGAHIDNDTLKIINCIGYPLFNGYGTTETAIAGANFAKKISQRTNGSIGNPFKSVNYKIDEAGTLIVSGKTICKRILSLNGEESNFDSMNTRSIKTNDIVKTINGSHFVVGRKSDLFIGQNGENISPDTIQNELTVKAANRFCVLELNGKLSLVLEYGERLPGIIINKEIEEIKSLLAKIAYGHSISGILVTNQPIANPNAIKVSRELLRRKISEGEIILQDYKKLNGTNIGKEESTDDETMILIKQAFRTAADYASSDDASARAEVLPTSNFFTDLGGDSLGYLSLVTEIEVIFNIKINIEKHQNMMTPQSFYKHIMERL